MPSADPSAGRSLACMTLIIEARCATTYLRFWGLEAFRSVVFPRAGRELFPLALDPAEFDARARDAVRPLATLPPVASARGFGTGRGRTVRGSASGSDVSRGSAAGRRGSAIGGLRCTIVNRV